MGGPHGEPTAAPPHNGSLAASPVLTRPLPFGVDPQPVQAAATSLQHLLSIVERLEAQFRSSGDAVVSSAHLTTRTESTGLPTSQPAPLPDHTGPSSLPSSSSSAHLLATLDALVNATAQGDAELTQQLTVVRRGVAVLAHDLHSLTERHPALQSHYGAVGAAAAASPTSQLRTPQVSPSALTPGSSVLRPAVVSPTTSPQLQAGSFGGRSGGLGDSLRSLVSMPSSTASPVKLAGGAPTTPSTSATRPPQPPPPPSPGRTVAASPASPSFSCLLHRTDVMLPAAQLPVSACAGSVKRYLAKCVEWPPRPRRRNVHDMAPRLPGTREAEANCTTDATRRGGVGGESECASEDEEGNFHIPATAASRQERDGAAAYIPTAGSRAPSTTVRRRCAHTDTDDFLQRLTEESPYDMSMLRTASLSPPQESDDSARQNGGNDSSSSSSSSDANINADDRQRRLSASADRAKRAAGGGGGGSGTLKGKRQRSCNDHDAQRNSAAKSLRHGRPTLVESVDALVLAQLRADGIPLSDEMVREMRGCAAATMDSASSTLARGKHKEEEMQEALLSTQSATTHRKSIEDGAAQRSDARPMKRKETDALDFAGVLAEIRGMVRQGRSVSTSLVEGHPPSSTTFPASPLSQRRWQQKEASLPLSPSPSVPALPTATHRWLAGIHDFCTLLDEMVPGSPSDASDEEEADEEESVEEERTESSVRRSGRAARRSGTVTTTATRERVSVNDDACRGSRASLSTSATASDTAAAANASDFSIADELFTSVEEADDGDRDPRDDPQTAALSRAGGGSSLQYQHETQQGSSAAATAGVAADAATTIHTARPPTADASVAEELPGVYRMDDDNNNNSATPHTTRSSAPAFSTATPPSGLSQTTAVPVTATAGEEEEEEASPASRDSTRVNALEGYWSGRGGPLPSAVPAPTARETNPSSGGARGARTVAGQEPSVPTNVASPVTRTSAGSDGVSVAAPGVTATAATTPGGPTFIHRGRRDERRQGRRTLQQQREAFLRERYIYQHLPHDEEPASHPGVSAPHSSKAKGDDASDGKAPFPNYRAAARELRALAALLLSDLTLVATLQDLSKLLMTTAAAAPSLAAAASSVWSPVLPPATAEAAGPAVRTAGSLAAASQVLLSLQQERSMQTRMQNELQLQGVSKDHYVNRVVQPHLSGATLGAPRPTHLLLSSRHPVDMLGYSSLLAHCTTGTLRPTGAKAFADDTDAASHRPFPAGSEHICRGNNEEEEEGERRRQLGRYVATVTPYLLAWRSDPGDGCHSIHTLAAPSSQAPLSVWVYVESITTELLEEARRLDSLYQLFLALVSEATVRGLGFGPERGGASELLLHHVRRFGRAKSIASNTGVAGPRLSSVNSLERFVTPISNHLLSTFDRLETRHLLDNVFHAVHLSDVMARLRVQRQLQQAKLSSTSTSYPAPPPVTAQRRSDRHTTAAVHGGGPEEGEGFDSFVLPPGTLSSSPALRSAAGVQWSMRDAEQRHQQERSTRAGASPLQGSTGGDAHHSDGDEPHGNVNEEEQQQRQGDSDVASHAQGEGGASRAMNRSGSTGSESRHVMIEGFVRYLTGGVERLRGVGGRGGRAAAEEEAEEEENGGYSPAPKATPQSPQQHHHQSGLTLDVPHTSSLLTERDEHWEKAASNLALIRAIEGDAATRSLLDTVLGVQGGKGGKSLSEYADVKGVRASKRRYFSTYAAAFAMPLPENMAAVSNPEDTAVVRCRWQPVFQSTMCFCPVTRRRCLDPLVCGALLLNSSMPPQEILLSNTPASGHDAGAFTRSSANGNGNTAAVTTRDSSSSSPHAGSTLPFPATIRALRSGIERVISARALGGNRPTPGPSVRGPDAPRSATAAASPSPASPPPGPAAVARVEPLSYGFPSFFLRQTMSEPEQVAIPRILAQTPTTLYADSPAIAGGSEGQDDHSEEGEEDDVSSVEVLPAATQRAPPIVTLPIESAPVTRNLLPSPEASQARWLNPPTLLECGHVIAHKTFLDLRGTARRSARTAAAPAMTVVCCPYCSKITAAKDALTLSYLF